MKPYLFFFACCACLLCGALAFKGQSLQAVFIFGIFALCSVGVLMKVLRS